MIKFNLQLAVLFLSITPSMMVQAKCAGMHDGIEGIRSHLSAKGKAIPFKQLDTRSYHAFVKSWDETKQPVLCALMKSLPDWNTLLLPATTMSSLPQSYGPPSSFFKTHDVLIVAKVTPAFENGVSPWHVNGVTLNANKLEVDYEFRSPSKPTQFEIRDYFLVTVSKATLAQSRQVRFIENGRVTCSVSADR